MFLLSFYFFNSKTNKYFDNIYHSSTESRIYLLFVNTSFDFYFNIPKSYLYHRPIFLENIETIAREVAKQEKTIKYLSTNEVLSSLSPSYIFNHNSRSISFDNDGFRYFEDKVSSICFEWWLDVEDSDEDVPDSSSSSSIDPRPLTMFYALLDSISRCCKMYASSW